MLWLIPDLGRPRVSPPVLHAMNIIYPNTPYIEALVNVQLTSLKQRHAQLCEHFFTQVEEPQYKLHKLLPKPTTTTQYTMPYSIFFTQSKQLSVRKTNLRAYSETEPTPSLRSPNIDLVVKLIYSDIKFRLPSGKPLFIILATCVDILVGTSHETH